MYGAKRVLTGQNVNVKFVDLHGKVKWTIGLGGYRCCENVICIISPTITIKFNLIINS